MKTPQQKNGGVNMAWLNQALERVDLNQAQLARRILQPSGKSMSRSTMTHLIKNKRKLRFSEAEQIAKILSVPIDEVFINFGLKRDKSVYTYNVRSSESRPDADSFFRLPARGLSGLDDKTSSWTVFVSQVAPPSLECIGNLCVAWPENETPVLAFIIKLKPNGEAELATLQGDVIKATIIEVAIVEWIKTR